MVYLWIPVELIAISFFFFFLETRIARSFTSIFYSMYLYCTCNLKFLFITVLLLFKNESSKLLSTTLCLYHSCFWYQLLWSFCYSELKEERTRPFRLTQAIPGASASLDYDVNSTFEESGLANSMVSVTWE